MIVQRMRFDVLTRGAAFSYLAVALAFGCCLETTRAQTLDSAAESLRTVVKKYCVGCHNPKKNKGKLDLDRFLTRGVAEHPAIWEKVLRKLDAGQMPPAGKRRPTAAALEAMAQYLTGELDAAAAKHPKPGRTDTFRRLNRTEYQNAIRDLLALDIDAKALLPADESSHGFDNVTVGDLSPALLTRYISAAQKISRLAIGAPREHPDGHTYRVRPDITQEKHVPGLPLGTRGGTLIRHTFPSNGAYEIQVRLTRDRNEHVEGLSGSHTLEILLDRARVADFEVTKPKKRVANHFNDTKLRARIRVTAGPHDLGVTFVKNASSLEETRRQPLNVHFNVHRHPRLGPAIFQVSITGPYPDTQADERAESITETPSRRRIFATHLAGHTIGAGGDEPVAKQILAQLARRAYRRPVRDEDLARPLAFYRSGSAENGFEAGIEMALSAILVSPRFLFRIERDPVPIAPDTPYLISEFELASRLSFFLWSSIPDDALLAAAERGVLRRADVIEMQVRRMLRDPRSVTLASNFASQWLHLRNLNSKTPDARLFPDFGDNLRQAMRRETELLFEELVREDRSVFDLIKTDHTHLNERLARHYGIPHIYGSRFRRVNLPRGSRRGGLLRHGSILTVTSYATRTSPVIRGKWILENILGITVPPPPDDVPSLDGAVISETLSVRQRLARHRSDSTCASCHKLMDPVGFALENFDAVGRWRDRESGRPVDVSGGLPDGSEFHGVAGLEAGILKRPKSFVGTMAKKLLTYALGRGIDHRDGPAVRQIVRDAKRRDYRFSAMVLGIVRSKPFQMRTSK